MKAFLKPYFTILIVALGLFTALTGYGQDSILPSTSIYNYHKKALTHIHRDELAPALEALNKAASIAEKEEDIKALLDTFQKFALLNLEMDNEATAIFYRDRSGILLKGIEYPHGEATHKYIDARLKLRENNPYQAKQLLEEAKTLSNEKNLVYQIQLTEADINTNLDKFGEAEKLYNSLLVNSDELERAYLASKANLGLAELKRQQGDLEKSSSYAESAFEIAQKHRYNRIMMKASQFLTNAFEKLGNYDKALTYTKAYIKIKDTAYTADKLKEESNTADKILAEQQSKTIADQEAKIEKLEQSENRAEVTAILSLAFLTIISLLAVSLFRNNQIKLRTNDLLQTKNTELEKARDEAISAMKAKSNFLSTVTHELRTPLYAVTGLTHILLEENPSGHQKEHLKSLKFSGDYLLNFINDILQINKIDADKVEILNTEFKLKKVLTDVVDSLQQNANEHKTKLILNYDDNIPVNLLGDPMKLSQIFMNLVGNALKFTKGGQVEVVAKLLNREDETAKVHFEVKDNGIGISEEMQKKIFDSFEQGSIQINREYGGTGLGLTIVKSLLGLFDRKIGLNSKLGEGSTFYFDLDFTCEENAISDVPFELNSEDFEFDGLHVLIVEDNKINQVITKKMLTKKGMTCDIANDGNEAVAAAKANRYDCILMDIHMPGLSGTEATIEIRKFDKEIPIIALTAISMEDSVEEFHAAGCDDVVTKPFKPEVFYQKIGENIFKSKQPTSQD